MKNKISRLFMVILVSMVVVALGASTAFAATVAPKKGQDAAKVIQKQLDKAKKKGTSKKPYVVTVKKGSYTLNRSLRVYSNTVLNLNGVTFKLKKSAGSNMIRIGDNHNKKKGYYYKNIVVNGGTFNGNKTKNTVLKVAHAKNVVFKGCTFKNAYNAHLAEVAAVDGFKVLDCTFRDQKRNNANASKVQSPEALQFDIINKTHFPTYRAEDLTVKNVEVDGCNFVNVPRGVGSHTGILNNPMRNIKVTNCTFSKIDSVAIQFQNTVDLVIEGNKINGVPRGIGVFSIGEQGMFLSKTLAKEGKTKARYSSKFKTPAKNQNIVVRNNYIDCRGKDPHKGFENEAIVIKGTYQPKAKKSTGADKLPAGDYFVSGVVVENNTIKTVGHGIRFRDTKDSIVRNNRVTFTGSKSGSAKYYGVQTIDRSANNTIESNKVESPKNVGIYVSEKSSASSVSYNTINSAGQYGISVYNGSSVRRIVGNTIARPAVVGIQVFQGSKVSEVRDNNITSPGKYDIYVK